MDGEKGTDGFMKWLRMYRHNSINDIFLFPGKEEL